MGSVECAKSVHVLICVVIVLLISFTFCVLCHDL